jgi:hypothetical protein
MKLLMFEYVLISRFFWLVLTSHSIDELGHDCWSVSVSSLKIFVNKEALQDSVRSKSEYAQECYTDNQAF